MRFCSTSEFEVVAQGNMVSRRFGGQANVFKKGRADSENGLPFNIA